MLMADWQLGNVGTTARVDVESGPQEFEVWIKNVGDQPSPAQDLGSSFYSPDNRYLSLLVGYQIQLRTGACGPWRDSNALPWQVLSLMPPIFDFGLSVRFAIPALAVGEQLHCRYQIYQPADQGSNVLLFFQPVTRPVNQPAIFSFRVGRFSDLSASAVLLGSTNAAGTEWVNRYRVVVTNHGNKPVSRFNLGNCKTAYLGRISSDFPGGCVSTSRVHSCFNGVTNFLGGSVAPGQQTSCEFEIRRDRNYPTPPNLRVDAIYDNHGHELFDVQPDNNALTLVSVDEFALRIPTLSWAGLFVLMLGIAIGGLIFAQLEARQSRRRS